MDPIELPYQGWHHGITMDASGLGNFSSINGSTILKQSQRDTIHIVATITSTVSLVAAICAMYWFIIMRRNFRRDLVLMLIAGGFWKSLWFFIFSVVTFARGQVQTGSAFCSASGYLLQVGFEACDVAVLFMSMHMYYQIFPLSRSMLGHDGLYRVRWGVFAIWVLFPNLSAGLAFINPRGGYMAQGAFCSIPLRPFWYRLGLFWIPRYLIWIYIVFVAIRIYCHVSGEFKIFGQEKASDSSVHIPRLSSIDRVSKEEQQHPEEKRRSQDWNSSRFHSRKDSADGKRTLDHTSPHQTPQPLSNTSEHEFDTTLAAHGVRYHPTPNQYTDLHDFGFDIGLVEPASRSTPSSRRGSYQIAPSENLETLEMSCAEQRQGSITSISTRKSSIGTTMTIPTLEPIDEASTPTDSSLNPRTQVSAAVLQRRRAIQRQLRLLFIYPMVYMMLWVIPFIVNIMNYTDYYAQHPVFALQILQVFMLTVMTHVDVVVFCWRERPWQHVPGSDGTFLGSLMWWRYCFDETWMQGRRLSRALSDVPEGEPPKAPTIRAQPRLWVSVHSSIFRRSSSPSNSQASSTTSAPLRLAVKHKRTFSGGSDRKVLAAERAHERLKLERADWQQNRQSLQDARASVIGSQSPVNAERKEWFDEALRRKSDASEVAPNDKHEMI